MIQLADAHCHLDASHFREGPELVLERARAGGVVGFVVVGMAADGEESGPTDDARLEAARVAVDLARRTP
ncbi:MAG TPA: hypothetical protein VHV30_04095, partial [Polyangiaceae bacterium]|nr:hypothetical protein [Polyangiaceae bacterium]